MGRIFNADEVFEMAQDMEVTGAKYYRDAAARFSDHPRVHMLMMLAQMEDEHFKQFGTIREQVKRAVRLPEVWDPEGEAAQYLRALSERKVFHPDEDRSQRFTGSESLREILARAIAMEKDSIVFYIGLKELVPADLGRAQVDEIIRQEMGHVTTLTQELVELK